MNHKQRLGQFGEQAAAAWLKSRGYEIVDVNIRTPYGEIDLITRLGGVTVFVEVKTRTTRSFGSPEEAVTPRKQAHLLACAEHYAAEHNIDHWQIDVLAIEKPAGQTASFTHFENILS